LRTIPQKKKSVKNLKNGFGMKWEIIIVGTERSNKYMIMTKEQFEELQEFAAKEMLKDEPVYSSCTIVNLCDTLEEIFVQLECGKEYLSKSEKTIAAHQAQIQHLQAKVERCRKVLQAIHEDLTQARIIEMDEIVLDIIATTQQALEAIGKG
jgi:hypothetical protein